MASDHRSVRRERPVLLQEATLTSELRDRLDDAACRHWAQAEGVLRRRSGVLHRIGWRPARRRHCARDRPLLALPKSASSPHRLDGRTETLASRTSRGELHAGTDAYRRQRSKLSSAGSRITGDLADPPATYTGAARAPTRGEPPIAATRWLLPRPGGAAPDRASSACPPTAVPAAARGRRRRPSPVPRPDHARRSARRSVCPPGEASRAPAGRVAGLACLVSALVRPAARDRPPVRAVYRRLVRLAGSSAASKPTRGGRSRSTWR